MRKMLVRAIALAAATGLVMAASVTTTPTAASSSLVFTGIRPGMWLTVGKAPVANCTASFVFQESPDGFDPSGQLYLATAAHCYQKGDKVEAPVVPPGGEIQGNVTITIGEVVFATPGDPNDLEDIALIAIDPALNDWVSPSMAYWGGPTGVYEGGPNVPVTFTGHGPRTGILTGYSSMRFAVAAPTVKGDSGAAVTTRDGLALGHVAYEKNMGTVDIRNGIAAVNVIGPSVPRIEELGRLNLPTEVHLATCRIPTPWRHAGCPPS